MGRDSHNVVAFPDRRAGRGPSPRVRELLRRTLEELDRIRDSVELVDPDPGWSAQDWCLESTPLRMRLGAGQRQLDRLTDIDPARWPDTDWALDVTDARFEIQQHLEALATALEVLLRDETPFVERAWEAGRFRRISRRLVAGLEGLRELILGQHPELRTLT